MSLHVQVQDEAAGSPSSGGGGNFANGEFGAVILGDNVFRADLAAYAGRFVEQAGARLLLKRVPDPSGSAWREIRDGRVVGIEEKPSPSSPTMRSSGCIFMIRLSSTSSER